MIALPRRADPVADFSPHRMSRTSLVVTVAGALALAGPLLAAVCLAAGPKPAPYGAKVAFRAGSPIRFADFSLTFLGTRRVASETYPRGFVFYDFRMVREDQVVTVSWSAGTGDIGPVTFSLGGRRFALELKRSDRLGVLGDDELVVTPAPPAE